MESKRTIIAIAISLLIWVGWYYFFMPKPDPNTLQQQEVTVSEEETAKESAETSANQQNTVPALQIAGTATTESMIVIDTDNYHLKMSNRGARIESILYKYADREIELVAGRNSEEIQAKGYFDFAVHFSEDEIINGNALDDILWNMQYEGLEVVKTENGIVYGKPADNPKSEERTRVLFSAETRLYGVPVRIEKEYTFNKNTWSFDLVYRLKNTGGDELQFPNGGVFYSAGDFLGPEMEDYDNRYNHVVPVYYSDDSFEHGSKGGGWFSTETRTKRETGVIDWYGLMSRYFVVIMIPENGKIDEAVWDSRGKTSSRIAGIERVKSIAPGQKFESSFKVAIGEKKEDILVSVDPSLKPATDVNKWIQPIRGIVMWCINKIHGFVGNLGIAIIIFSIITKLIFLPLTQKSTKSMQKMSELGPKMNEIKEKYKDKPEEMQRRTMQLYKEQGVNPLSGCLPMLVQMPFFIALYSALSNTLDSHNAPFMLWIKDLSLPDTVFTMYGFNLNILPILMTVTMYFSTRMSQSGAAVNDQQQMMMKLMPLIFIVMFWNMPSGLIIYWIVQNILQIAHQYYIKARTKKA